VTTTTRESDSHDLRGIAAMLAKARELPPLERAPLYIRAGNYLAHFRSGRPQAVWVPLVRAAGLSQRRAYELMSIAAGGRRALQQLRAEKAATARRHRGIDQDEVKKL